MVARSTIKLDESQTLNLRKLSYVGGLTSKGQVGVLLGEHRGWILRMAFSYNAKIFRTKVFFPLFQHTAFYFPPPAKGWRSILSLQRGKRAACFPFVQLLDSYLFPEDTPYFPCRTFYFALTYEPWLIPT